MKHYELEPFTTFDFKKRFIIKEKGNIIFIKILFSDINNWNVILSEIFNKNIVIYKANLTKYKEVNSLYNEFKKKL